jgi:hypothetical protein
MASKSGSIYREDMLTPPRRERTGRTVAAAAVGARRAAPDVAQPLRSNPAPANFDPSSSRDALIATAAYYRAESRGFAPGHETEDWLAAEREIDGAGDPSLP